jgi:hypothetical protein
MFCVLIIEESKNKQDDDSYEQDLVYFVQIVSTLIE